MKLLFNRNDMIQSLVIRSNKFWQVSPVIGANATLQFRVHEVIQQQIKAEIKL